MKDRTEQIYLRAFLEAYAANAHRTEGNLPGGGRLFEERRPGGAKLEPVNWCVFCRGEIATGDVCRPCHDEERDR